MSGGEFSYSDQIHASPCILGTSKDFQQISPAVFFVEKPVLLSVHKRIHTENSNPESRTLRTWKKKETELEKKNFGLHNEHTQIYVFCCFFLLPIRCCTHKEFWWELFEE